MSTGRNSEPGIRLVHVLAAYGRTVDEHPFARDHLHKPYEDCYSDCPPMTEAQRRGVELAVNETYFTDRRMTQPDWCNAPQPSNWQNACMRAPGHEGAHAVRKHYRLHEAWTWDNDEVVHYAPAFHFDDLWCPDCDGEGFIVEPSHGCGGIETVCEQICPVPEQFACRTCAPPVRVPPLLDPEDEPF